VVISVSSEVVQRGWRHRRTGYSFGSFRQWEDGWTDDARSWLSSAFDEVGPIPIAKSRENLYRCISELHGKNVVLVNMFRAVSGEKPVQHRGLGESIRERIRRVNLLTAQLSHSTGARVVDLNGALGRVGAAALGGDYALSSEASRALAVEETCRVLGAPELRA
jgi:hypothetical protein